VSFWRVFRVPRRRQSQSDAAISAPPTANPTPTPMPIWPPCDRPPEAFCAVALVVAVAGSVGGRLTAELVAAELVGDGVLASGEELSLDDGLDVVLLDVVEKSCVV
jgi:hypothetical protein